MYISWYEKIINNVAYCKIDIGKYINCVNYRAREYQAVHGIPQIQDGPDVSMWHDILKVSYFLIEYQEYAYKRYE